MIAKTRGQLLGVLGPRVNKTRAFATGTPVVATPGFDGVLVRAHREAHIIREHSIVANEAQAAAPATRPARVGNHFEAFTLVGNSDSMISMGAVLQLLK